MLLVPDAESEEHHGAQLPPFVLVEWWGICGMDFGVLRLFPRTRPDFGINVFAGRIQHLHMQIFHTE